MDGRFVCGTVCDHNLHLTLSFTQFWASPWDGKQRLRLP